MSGRLQPGVTVLQRTTPPSARARPTVKTIAIDLAARTAKARPGTHFRPSARRISRSALSAAI
jgi:hypothetical protein